MTTENKDLIRRWLSFAESGFRGSFGDYIADDYVGHLSASETMNASRLEEVERTFAAAFSDTHYVIHDLLAEADKVVLRVETRTTHTGTFYGIAATGKNVAFTGIVIYRLREGRIAESWAEIDFGSLLRQLRQV